MEIWFENRRVKHQDEVAAAALGFSALYQQGGESGGVAYQQGWCQGCQITRENPAEYVTLLFEAEKDTFTDEAKGPKAVYIEEHPEHPYVAAPVAGCNHLSSHQSAQRPSPRDGKSISFFLTYRAIDLYKLYF